MQVPESDIQFNRVYDVNLHIDWNKNILYVNLDENIPVESLERFSLFSVIGDDVRLIANLNDRQIWSDGVNFGWRIGFDPQWQSGTWTSGISVVLGFQQNSGNK